MSATEPQRNAAGASDDAPAAQQGAPSGTVARNAFHLVLGQLASTVLGLGLTAALGRFLGKDGYGTYFLLTTVATFAYVAVDWGQTIFVTRAVATHPERCGELLGTSLWLRILFTLAVTLPAGLATWVAGEGRSVWFAMAFVIALLPFVLAQGYGMAFRGLDRMGGDALVTGTNKALLLVLTVPALILGGRLGAVILMQGVGGVAALLLAAALYRRMRAPPLRVSRTVGWELLAGGMPLLALTAASSVQPFLDSVVLAKLGTHAALSWYGAARNIMLTLFTPASILGTAFYPRLSRAARDPADLRATAGTALRAMLWLGALGGTGTFLFGDVAVRLIYGAEEFGPASLILQVFAPGLFLLFIDMLLGTIVFARGGSKAFAVAKVVSVIVSTGLDVLLIPYFEAHHGNGGVGVVVAFALSEFVVFAGAMFVLPRGTFAPRSALDVARALAAAGVTVLAFRWLPALPPAVALLVAAPACVAVFTGASVALRLVSRADLSMFKALLRPRTAGGERGAG